MRSLPERRFHPEDRSTEPRPGAVALSPEVAVQDIRDFDRFVRNRLFGTGLPDDPTGDGSLALDIALLSFEPADWARHWADAALELGLDPRGDEPDRLTVLEARRMLHVWAAPPEERLTVAEVWLAVNSSYPLLAAEIAPTASALDDVRSFEDRMS